MNFSQLLSIELLKTKRAKILPLILIPPLLVVFSGVANISTYFTPEYNNAWQAMFVQSVLLFGYYLLPFSMVIVCAMIAGRETKDNGIIKMLSLPISRSKLALSKFVVLLCYLAMELMIFFVAFVVAGLIATQTANITEAIPIAYILKWSVYLFASSLPCVAVMWLLTVIFEKPAFSIGLNILFIIPGVFAANTQYWILYPYCYNGFLVSREMQRLTDGAANIMLNSSAFLPCAIVILAVAMLISVIQFGKKEMK